MTCHLLVVSYSDYCPRRLRKERPIFGKIRFMNYAGCKRKFKIDPFVARYKGASENAAKVSGGSKSGSEKISGKKRKA